MKLPDIRSWWTLANAIMKSARADLLTSAHSQTFRGRYETKNMTYWTEDNKEKNEKNEKKKKRRKEENIKKQI